jgi:hypothetical protein
MSSIGRWAVDHDQRASFQTLLPLVPFSCEKLTTMPIGKGLTTLGMAIAT